MLEPCDGACVDTQADPDHCDGCGVVCDQGLACVGGSCSAECPMGRELCDRMCVDLDEDPQHCGGCEAPCAVGAACENGECVGA